MRIVIPKPRHGWRAFAGEVGIIVLGVLMALGAGQLVENFNERNQRESAREAVRGELSQNLDQLRRRAEVQACIETRLVELERLLVSTPDGSALAPMWVGRPQVWHISDTLWLVAASAQRTVLIPTGEQANYARLYRVLREFDQYEQAEQSAWVRLRVLGLLPRLESRVRADLLTALLEARYANFRIKVAASQAHDAARELGIRTVRSPFPEGSRSVCIPMNTPRDQAMKIATQGREEYGEP